MRRPIRLLTLTCTMALAPGLLLASMSAQGSAAPGSANAADSVDAKRGSNGKWTRLSTAEVNQGAAPGFVRGSDGKLHVFHTQESGSLYDIVENEIGKGGTLGSRRTAVDNWSDLTTDPDAIRQGSSIRLVFAGNQTDDGAGYYSQGKAYNALSASGHGGWALQPETLVEENDVYSGYGAGAVTTAGGVPAVAYGLNDELIWHEGTIPQGTTGTDSRFTLGAGTSTYSATLVRDGSKVYAAWYSGSKGSAKQGIFVKQILPTEGPAKKAPLSTVKFGGSTNSIQPNGPIAMVRRAGGGIYLAYCVGYPSCSYVGLWQYGSTKVKKLPGSTGAVASVALAAAPGGQLWAAWEKTNERAYAVRTAKKGTRTGPVRSFKNPSGQPFMYGVFLDAGTGKGDLVINTGKALYHQQVLPGMSLSASPAKWRGNRSKTVTFKVTDAGSVLKGATVKAFGKKCTTNSLGKCNIRFRKMSPRRGTAVAVRYGYVKASKTLRVVR